jgi:hypothetical protein
MKGLLMTDELRRMWKEEVLALLARISDLQAKVCTPGRPDAKLDAPY